MKIVAVADLHGYLPTDIEECDLLIVAGDICPVDQSHEPVWQERWLTSTFLDWLSIQPAKRIVGLAGNHDFALEKYPDLGPSLPWTYLKDSSVTIDGWKLYGYPWVPNLQRWAFYAPDMMLRQHAQAIPEDTDILVTHGPPQGIRDAVSWAEHVGDKHLYGRLMHPHKKQPKYHFFGHIHEGHGVSKIGDTEFHGVSIMDENYIPRNKQRIIIT